MQINVETLNRIYEHLGDEKSRDLFKNRLMYSIFRDTSYIIENLKYVQNGKFLELLINCATSGELVMFGSGARGKALHRTTRKYPWKFFVDNNPKESSIQGLPVIAASGMLKYIRN